jgi:hypothetical protein
MAEQKYFVPGDDRLIGLSVSSDGKFHPRDLKIAFTD